MKQFIFFSQSDQVLFVRTDAEQANWQVDELSFTCLFPYDEAKVITRGMRIGFEDDDRGLQPFEVRKVKNYEPDHYQELTCEHIVISELTDIHTTESEHTNVPPATVLSSVLLAQPDTIRNEKRWTLGNVIATDTSSGDVGMGSAWQNIRQIEQNWNVYILPRVTFNSTGITGRYLDVIPAGGVWHGLRLSIDKNIDNVGVTFDDTEVKTALYGYGGTAYDVNPEDNPLDKDSEKITLVGYTWPGKPDGASINSTLGYITDTAATTAFGRNGQPRFGFYQNSDITDQATLAAKTWEALQATKEPRITIDCTLRDLYRMGYKDEKVRLHDTVLVEIRPVNYVVSLEIIKLSVDLLDPTATRPTIGDYIPNIIYIQRETARQASGAVSGSLSGRRGGQTDTEVEWSEFTAGIDANNLLISLHAEQVNRSNEILRQAGISLDAQGVIVYATDNVNNIQSKINVEADRISQIVTAVGDDGEVTAASIVAAINDDNTSSAIIDADHVYLNATSEITLSGMVSVNGTTFEIAGGASGDGTLGCGTIECNMLEVDEEISTASLIILSTGSAILRNVTIDEEDCTLKTVTAGGQEISNVKVLSSGTATSLDIPDAISALQIVAPSSGSNTYTLQKKTFSSNSWTDVGTFSRATTLSGAWDSGVFTVSASPQGDEITTSLTNTGHWGVAANGEDENTYYYATYATIGSGTIPSDTGNSTTISGLGRFNAGVTEGESHFSPAGRVYTRGTSPHYFGSAGTIYEATGHIYLKLHTASETPTGSWYSTQSSSAGATLTLYTRSARTDLYVSGSGTPYYASTGFSDNYYTYTG